MIYRKWDIILVSFPFTNLKSSKKRPALIISPNEYNSKDDLIIAFITSQIDRAYRTGDYHIQEWQQAKLPKPSMIRMKLATIEKSIVVKKLGQLPENDIQQFQDIFSRFFTR